MLSGELGITLALKFKVIEVIQEHDPGEHRQAVGIAIEHFVLAHDVACGFQERAKQLGGGGLPTCLFRGQWKNCQDLHRWERNGFQPSDGILVVQGPFVVSFRHDSKHGINA